MTPKNPKLGKKFPLPVRRSQRTLNFAFIESFFTNAPPSMIVSMYQTIQTIYAPETIWMTKKNFESSRWQQDAFESWYSLQMGIGFTPSTKSYIYCLSNARRKCSKCQTPGRWDGTRFNLFYHSSPNRRVHQPSCELKTLQNNEETGKVKLGRFSGLDGQRPWEVYGAVTHQNPALSCRPLWYLNSISNASGSTLLRATNWRLRKVNGTKHLTPS